MLHNKPIKKTMPYSKSVLSFAQESMGQLEFGSSGLFFLLGISVSGCRLCGFITGCRLGPVMFLICFLLDPRLQVVSF